MTLPTFSRGPRATPARRVLAATGLLLAAWAVLTLGAAPCSAAQSGAPATPVRRALSSPVVSPGPPEKVAPTASPVGLAEAAPAPSAKAGDTESSGTLDLADLDKSLSKELVTLDTPDLRRLLGENPDFVYDAHGRRDPMLLPWEHLRARATALLGEADRALKFGNLDLAERLYGMVRETVAEAERQQLPGQESFDKFREQADAGSQKVLLEKQQHVMGSGTSAGPAVKPVVPLPGWVRTHTSGVIISAKESLCLVGPYTLKVGDKVPGQPVDVEVFKIEKRAVTYRVAGETFVVGLEEGE